MGMSIKLNQKWTQLEALFNSGELEDRYEWFLYEFGKRMTMLIHNELLGKISNLKGPADYKKRVVVAEIRDKGGKAWWAIAGLSKTLAQNEYDPEEAILNVVPRYALGDGNPIDDILVDLGPWTASTLPFVPSLRQAVVVIKRATPESVDQVRRKNLRQAENITKLMEDHDLEFDTRYKIYDKLKIVPDLAVEAMKLEFGLSEGGKAHWRPSIEWGKKYALDVLRKDTDLLRALTDPKFRGYKVKKHLEYVMTPTEVKRLEEFQRKLRKTLK